MEGDIKSWLYLASIVGSFQHLIEYYFNGAYFYGAWFRQAGIGLLYSVGLAWAGFCFLKAPVDRLLAGLSVMGMVVLAGFLMSPTTNTKNLGAASGAELSVGAYYSYVIAGTITQQFNDVIDASWKVSISDAVGNSVGPTKEAVALAFNDKSEEFADRFIGDNEGREAYLDYMQQCGSEALKFVKTDEDKENLKSIGIGANTLGMASNEASEFAQKVKKRNMAPLIGGGIGVGGDSGKLLVVEREAAKIDAKKAQAMEFLKNLPIENSQITGTKGYRIPTPQYYSNLLGNTTGQSSTGSDVFKSITESDSQLASMLANGNKTVVPGSEDDYRFFPKNCAELYLVASEVMSSFRQGVKNVPGMEGLDETKGYQSLSAANKVREAANRWINEQLKKEGSDERVSQKVYEPLLDGAFAGASAVGKKFNKFMLQFMIPSLIAMMALLVAVLLITFPIFCLTSVIFGYKVLVTYFKLMALPFIAVFVNNLILSLSASYIAFNKQYAAIDNTFSLGGVDMPAAISVMNTESIIFATICICELAIAKFILWDDVKAVTSFNPASAGMSAATRGAGLIASAVALTAGMFTKGARLASARKQSKNATGMGAALSSINAAVTQIADGGRARTGANQPFRSSKGASSSSAQPSASSPKGPSNGSLVPPPQQPPKS